MGGGSEQIEIEGLQVAFERAGDGPPLVLVHGGLGDSRGGRRQLDVLSDEFTVVAWDAPGCGRSSDPPESFRVPDYADCLAGFVHALGSRRPHVLGLSFGGGLALELYRRHPRLPRTLILASAYAGWAGSLPPDDVEQRLQQASRDADLPPDQVARGFISGLFTETAPRELIDKVLAMMCEFLQLGCERWLARSPKLTCARSYRTSTYRRCCSMATPTGVHHWPWPRNSTPRSTSRRSSSSQTSGTRATSRPPRNNAITADVWRAPAWLALRHEAVA